MRKFRTFGKLVQWMYQTNPKLASLRIVNLIQRNKVKFAGFERVKLTCDQG